MKVYRYWGSGSKSVPTLRVITADAKVTQRQFSDEFGCGVGSINKRQGYLVYSGTPAIEFLKFHNLPLGEFEGWVPKQDSYKYLRLPDSHFINTARNYKLRSEWKKHANGEYQHVHKQRKHLIESCTAHMEKEQGPFSPGYQLYAYLFTDNSVYVGITCNPKRRHKAHDRQGVVFEKAKTVNCQLSVVSEGHPPTEAARLEIELIKKYTKSGYTVLNSHKGGSTGQLRTKYTYEKVLETARQYPSKKAFRAANNGMAQAATLRGWNRQLDQDRGWPRYSRHKWTFEKCRKVAKAFDYLSDWASAPGGSYVAASKQGWLKKIKAELFTKTKPVDIKWTYKACLERARDFSTRSAWQYESGDGSYRTACRKGWLKQIFDEVGLTKKSRWAKNSSPTSVVITP